ncbi:uncharacterized protein LOC142788963 [Rhipicephalus microplus]|uniref:uncharacterized protein LOC142788963 n=1 Tax=Rhipicephalus microplus TaxID=6941 RepID=UPI003F6BA801
MVRTIKDFFNKSPDWPLALLSYRNAPGVTGNSPDQLLMGRSLRTRLPLAPATLLPKPPFAADFSRCVTAQRCHYCQGFNRRPAVKVLRPLVEGKRVWIRDMKCADTVLSLVQCTRSYMVQTDTGALVRDHRHLVPQQSQASVGGDFSSITPLPEGSPTPLQTLARPAPECRCPPPPADVVDSSPAASPQVVPATPSRPPASSVFTLSGRNIRPPVRLNLNQKSHRHTTTYHPRANGLTKRLDKLIADMAAIHVNFEHKTWDVILLYVIFPYNTAVQEATQMSSCKLVYERNLSVYDARRHVVKCR